MLTPSEYDRLCDELIPLYDALDRSIIEDMIRRIMRMGEISESTKWQARMLQESGMLYDDIIADIAAHTDASQAQVRTLFEDSGVQSVRNDNRFYRAAGLEGIVRMSDAALQTLNAGYQKCRESLKNLTLTTANTSQQQYINACNLAYMQVTSGAFDYNTAIRKAVQNAAEQGSYVMYPSGHTDRLDVAVRRAVMTGVGQTVRKLSEINAADMGTDLMEITAHSGARPSHAEWQGQIVSLSGRKGYLSKSDIGYGTGDGFGGWNCRHDWFPFFEGASQRAYTPERLDELNARNIEYDGKKYTQYEISQIQRKMERDIRAAKRGVIAADTARKNAGSGALEKQFDEDFTTASVKLKSKEKKLSDFLDKTKQLPDNARTQVLGFGRSETQKAVWADKKSPLSLTKLLNDGTIKDKEMEFKKALKLGRFNTKIDVSSQKKHQLTPEWKNQVKQAVKSNGKQIPKSRLDKNIDPQKIVDKYGGTGKIRFSNDGKTANEFIVFPNPIGRTFDKKLLKYVPSCTLQIKYCDSGTHVFPTMDGVI